MQELVMFLATMTEHCDVSLIQADFDRLAAFSQDGWNHNRHYHRFLLRHVPQPCQQALEVGCGSGAFARLLATQAEQVLALDVSPQMIRLAEVRSQQYPHITFHMAKPTQVMLDSGGQQLPE
jgi:ubiquinone/menaquinone biosynthesis C-methylase UbiE